MKIAILGFAREGRAAYEYWSHGDNQLTICDQNSELALPEDADHHLGDDYLKGLDRFDLIVRTAGLPPQKILQTNPGVASKITTSANEFLRACPTRNIIGVTGTKGKGTTCTLLAKMLKAAGKTVHLGGNIGIAPLTLLRGVITPDDWVILELSSHQLADIKHSPHIAVCLMVEPEHLQWHGELNDYLNAKQQLFRWQKPGDIAIYHGGNQRSIDIAAPSPGKHIPYMTAPGAEVVDDKHIVISGQTVCDVTDIQLLGKHNWQNVCAALTAAWQVTQDITALRRAIKDFRGLPHRLELVRDVDGVQYYNDSFSSAPGATIAALEAIPGKKVLIVGGFDKGLDLSDLAQTIRAHSQTLQRVLLIGEIAPQLQKALETVGFENYETLDKATIQTIVQRAHTVAKVGNKVILSPGTSSFDMFKDFEDRGLQFKAAVQAL
jgi:UDP-N-acetylmuramoylalanine--D-glutamate ligase